MSKTVRCACALSVVGSVALGWAAGCSSNNETGGSDAGADARTMSDAASQADVHDSAASNAGDAADAGDASTYVYTLIDDMETTTHGPIELTGIHLPESPGYWFNFGGSAVGDTLSPPYQKFAFAPLPTATTTLNGKASHHAAYELCALNGQYDVCGVGFEFAQVPIADGGGAGDAALDASDAADAETLDAGQDAGEAGVPMMTVPFDISKYKGIVFWGMTTGADAGGADAGTLDIKVLFPDTDTDPRGGVCNSAAAGASGPTDTSECYNSYANKVVFTDHWQEFTVMFDQLKIDPTFGFQHPGAWTGKNVYGINWQGQDNNKPDSGTVTMDLWVDDVYFIQ